tara:strand:+ start:1217 stop:1357 length:141 start_codon:yes stop_codon:yes gene_type:complete
LTLAFLAYGRLIAQHRKSESASGPRKSFAHIREIEGLGPQQIAPLS